MKKVCLFFFIIIFIALPSCHKSVKKQMKDLVSEWMNKDVLIPQDAVFISLFDTINVDYNKYQLKIITYTDANGCIGCQLRLNEWNKFNKEIFSYTKDQLLVLKIIAPNRASEAFFELKSANYEYPVWIDLDDKFNKSNQLPEDKAFRCFLLDEKNRVLLIGDPISYPNIKELYIRTICERLGIERPTEHVEPQRVTNGLGVFNWQVENLK